MQHIIWTLPAPILLIQMRRLSEIKTHQSSPVQCSISKYLPCEALRLIIRLRTQIKQMCCAALWCVLTAQYKLVLTLTGKTKHYQLHSMMDPSLVTGQSPPHCRPARLYLVTIKCESVWRGFYIKHIIL